jgi:hypothetical protein
LGLVLCLAAVGAAQAVEAARLEQGLPRALTTSSAQADRLEDQLVRGRLAYGLNCISCHANRLQGLTDEWRSEWDPDHQDCWKSKCHSVNHPPDGFIIPRWAPPLQEAMLSKYATAEDLFQYISVAMPFQEPGVLSEEKYWDIEAYILHENGLRWGGEALGADNATTVRLTTPSPAGEPTGASVAPPPPASTAPPAASPSAPPEGGGPSSRTALWIGAGIGLLALAGGALLWRTRPRA